MRLRGTAVINTLAGEQTAGTHIYLVDSAGVASAAGAVNAINAAAGGAYSAENAHDVTLFAVSDGNGNTNLWHADFDHTGGGTTLEAGDMIFVAQLSGVTKLETTDFL